MVRWPALLVIIYWHDFMCQRILSLWNYIPLRAAYAAPQKKLLTLSHVMSSPTPIILLEKCFSMLQGFNYNLECISWSAGSIVSGYDSLVACPACHWGLTYLYGKPVLSPWNHVPLRAASAALQKKLLTDSHAMSSSPPGTLLEKWLSMLWSFNCNLECHLERISWSAKSIISG